MKAFQHKNSQSLDEAVELLLKNPNDARAFSGGTDLLGVIKDSIYPDIPGLLVNLKTIRGLNEIEERPDGLFIGAAARLHDIAHHPIVRKFYTALQEAAQSIATPQIRRMATLAGNLCQEPRCWYYRQSNDLFHCLRKGGEMCGALVGENRFHSIFGAVRVNDTPCIRRCPVSTLIPDYMEAIRDGKLDNAARVLLAANPIPFVTGRVCPHFCQEGCNREDMDQSVSIREVERTLGDYILENGKVFYQPPQKESGNRVAVIGSGPAGLAAACELRRLGHSVTVFERLPQPGGMLRYAIPAYRLPAEIVDRFIDLLQGMGITFRCNVTVGRDVAVDEIKQQYQAVFLATGAWKTPQLGIPGEHLTLSGLEFLRQIRQGERQAPGQRVVVIGGGNVAVDVAISVGRLGAASVTMICLEKPAEMPALEWELDQALEEQVKMMNGWGPKKILSRDKRVIGIELMRCVSVFDELGRFFPRYDPETTKIVECDTVLMAVGQRPETDALPVGIQMEGFRPAINAITGLSSIPGIFVGGDMLHTANVIDAVADGRRGATAIHYSLSGQSAGTKQGKDTFHHFDLASSTLTQGAMPQLHPLTQRRIDEEDTRSQALGTIRREAARCLNCGCVAVTPSDIAPVLVALDAIIYTTRRKIPAMEFFACKVKSSTVLEQDELIQGVFLPEQNPGARSVYRKFRLRQSIDFPVVSVAVRLEIQSGFIRQARVVLGAVAPVPLRAVEAEAFLEGKTLQAAQEPDTGSLALPAGNAASLALHGAIPLAENAYKIQITRAYVRRAILACLGN